MIEKYVIEKLEGLEKEKEQLINRLSREMQKDFKIVDAEPIVLELKSESEVIKILKENNYDLQEMYETLGTYDLSKIISELKLYRRNKYEKSEEYEGVILAKGKYYVIEKMYRGYELRKIVSITIEDAIETDLVDKLDNILREHDYARKEKEKEDINNE